MNIERRYEINLVVLRLVYYDVNLRKKKIKGKYVL